MSDEQVESWLHRIDELVKLYAQAKAQRVYLEQFRKSQKALLMQQAQEEDPEKYKSAAAQEVYAYSHEDYVALIQGLREATELESKHFWNLKQREWKFEEWRTRQANQRSERARYGA